MVRCCFLLSPISWEIIWKQPYFVSFYTEIHSLLAKFMNNTRIICLASEYSDQPASYVRHSQESAFEVPHSVAAANLISSSVYELAQIFFSELC